MNPQERFFLEIILQAADFTLHARDDVEDPLHDALTATGLGEVTGAGSGLGVSNIGTAIYLHEGDHSLGTGRVTAYPLNQQP